MKFIKIKTQFEFYHCYPKAPEQVSFLRLLHRHIFYVEAKIQVFNNDRELEFFIVKQVLDKYITDYLKKLSVKTSCETFAEKLVDYIRSKFGCNRYVEVGVYEDNENGAIIQEDAE